jgi:hypothetical protein
MFILMFILMLMLMLMLMLVDLLLLLLLYYFVFPIILNVNFLCLYTVDDFFLAVSRTNETKFISHSLSFLTILERF